MHKHTLAAALGATTLLITAGATATAYAGGVSNRDQKAPVIKVTTKDAKGDLKAETGSLNDLADNGPSPFKGGHGTVATPTTDDQAADLTSVAYKVVRTGKKPALTITYTSAGTFSSAMKVSPDGSVSASLDAILTGLGRGYSVDVTNNKKFFPVGITNRAGKPMGCSGLRASMPKGSHVATVSVPLSCLSSLHLTAAAPVTMAMHLAVSVSSAATASDPDVTIAWDRTAKSRTLPLTPLH
jgi:hypothetical protein